MDLGIAGRKALINGGSAGLGRGAALALAREGVEVFISARREDRLRATCDFIAEETGAKVTPIVADHSSDAGREAILAICPDPDILVGTCAPPPFTNDYLDVTIGQWREGLELTLLSPVQFMKAVLPGMVKRRWGRIVNIATAAAKFPQEVRVLSGPPRAALVNYSVAVSKAVARHNVTINTLLPGMHDTDGIREEFGRKASEAGISYDDYLRNFMTAFPNPTGRFGNAEDAGKIVAMFCGEFASFVSGQSLVVDGGATRSLF